MGATESDTPWEVGLITRRVDISSLCVIIIKYMCNNYQYFHLYSIIDVNDIILTGCFVKLTMFFLILLCWVIIMIIYWATKTSTIIPGILALLCG